MFALKELFAKTQMAKCNEFAVMSIILQAINSINSGQGDRDNIIANSR